MFTDDLDDIMKAYPGTNKKNATRFIKKHLIHGVHYTTSRTESVRRGGHNKVIFKLTPEANTLFRNSFKRGVTYAPERECATIMSLENQTVGFIHASYDGVTPTVRQHRVGSYRLDLCFTAHMLGVECDEIGHRDRDPIQEKAREDFVLNEGYMLIRFNPNSACFRMADVLNQVNRAMLNNGWSNTCVRVGFDTPASTSVITETTIQKPESVEDTALANTVDLKQTIKTNYPDFVANLIAAYNIDMAAPWRFTADDTSVQSYTGEAKPAPKKTDYAAFIADMCELRDDAKTTPAELMGAHRLWARANDKDTREGLSLYLNKRFARKKLPYSDGSVRISFVGVALKPLTSAIKDPTPESTDLELFLHSECREDFVGRAALAAVLARFQKWKRSQVGCEDYDVSADKSRVDDHMRRVFFRAHLCTGASNEAGYFGVIFKDDKAKVGVKENSGRKAGVALLDQEGAVVKLFDSAQECATWFVISVSGISQDISNERLREGYRIRKVKDVDAALIEAHDPATAPGAPPGPARVKVAGTGQWRKKSVEEVNADTGDVTRTFNTVKEAAEEASVESARMSTIISKSRKHGDFYYRFATAAESATH